MVLDTATQQLINHWLHLAFNENWLALEESLNLYHSKHSGRTNTDEMHNPSVGSQSPNSQVRRNIIMAQTQQNQDFQPLPVYKETSVSNASYVNVTLTRIDPDGTTTQTSFIASKK